MEASIDHSGATVPGLHRLPAMTTLRPYAAGLRLSTIAHPMIATRLTLICHAPTLAARASVFPLDEPIDENRARKMLAYVRKIERTDRVWLSPAMCAGQTARLLDLSGEVESDLRDCDYGYWAGRTLEEIHKSNPEFVASWMADPAAAPHGGESVVDLVRRIGTWLDHRVGDEGYAVAVSHASIIRAAIVYVLKADPASFWRIDIEPLSRTLLTASHGQWRLRAIERAG